MPDHESSSGASRDDPAPAPGPRPAERDRGRWGRTGALAGVVLALVALDLWSKSAVFTWLDEHRDELTIDGQGLERRPLVGEWLALMKNYNYGAAFGRLGEIPRVLVTGRILAVLLLGWLVHRAPVGHRVYLSALVLILAGALGNLYDNLCLEPLVEGKPFGPVRDFLDVYFVPWDWHFPTFNLADCCISVGAVLLLVSGFTGGSSSEEPAGAGG